MARSYFSRILGSAPARQLAPPRPVANLWRWARIDRVAAQAAVPAEGATPRPPRESPLRQRESMAPPRPIVAGKAPFNGPARGDQNLHAAASVLAPVAESAGTPSVARSESGGREADKRMPVGQSAKIFTPRLSPAAPPEFASAPARALKEKAKPTEPRPAESASLRGMIEPTEPRRVARNLSSLSSTPPLEDAKESGNRPPRPELAGERIAPLVLEPPRPAESLPGPRVEAFRQPERWKNPRDTGGNRIEIGTIEVLVTPPPAVRYAPPAAPKGRLARGYALWAGLPQT